MKKNFTLFFRSIFLLTGFFIVTEKAFAQDIQLSQYYTAPLYLNPGFSGGAHNNRAMVHQRLQWPKLDAKYITSMFSFDKFFAKYNSGVSVMALQDIQGANTISSTDLTFQYAYELQLNSQITVRPGLQLGLVSRAIDYSRLTFPHQYNDNGFINEPSEYYGTQRINYADVSTGGLVYSQNLWFGFSAHHINQPNQSFNNEVSRLPVKYTFMTGYRIPLIKQKYKTRSSTSTSITPSAHYKFQGKSDQLDMGVYGNYDQLLLGMWYKGIPTKKYVNKLHNNESIVVLAGWRYQSLIFTYSYDLTVSRLRLARTGGAHEINITFVQGKKLSKKKMKRLPCPSIYDK